MAVKYVKDFAFDSGFGFTGSSGGTPVKSYMRSPMKKGMGGGVKAGPKAPAIAPAMVEKRSQGLGGKTPETKKLAAYNKPHTEGKKGASVPQYGKGGAAKKKMPSFLKSKIAKKADGGMVRPYEESEFGAPTNELINVRNVGAGRGPPGDDTDYGAVKDNFVGILPFEPPPLPPEPQSLPEARYMRDVETRLDRGMRPGQMARQQRIEDRINAEREAAMRPARKFVMPGPGKGPDPGGRPMMKFEEPRESIMPVPGPGGGGSSELMPLPEEMPDRDIRSGPRMERWSDGTYHFLPEMSGQRTPIEALPTNYQRLTREALAQKPAPSPLAAVARMVPQDRRAMRADRNEMARNIMDRYIAGPRRAMPAPRRAMPVAPRKPMVDRSQPQPYMGVNLRDVPVFKNGGKVSKGQAKVGKVMGEFKRGELHSGSKKGPVVTNPKQAKAIALSEARAAGAKIPKKAMGGKACG